MEFIGKARVAAYLIDRTRQRSHGKD